MDINIRNNLECKLEILTVLFNDCTISHRFSNDFSTCMFILSYGHVKLL